MALIKEIDYGTPIRVAEQTVTLTIDGMEVTVKLTVRPGSNNVTIARSGTTDTIDGATSKTLDTLYQSLSLKYDATDNVWYII